MKIKRLLLHVSKFVFAFGVVRSSDFNINKIIDSKFYTSGLYY